MQFRRQNPNQRQTGPLPETETRKQLLAGVLQRGLYAINGGNGQMDHLVLTSPRYRAGTSAVNAISMLERRSSPRGTPVTP